MVLVVILLECVIGIADIPIIDNLQPCLILFIYMQSISTSKHALSCNVI